ncbi:MAG TPA: thermonuclease family protein [Sphingobium sp.]|nr:thermonuclease family protein [Sphingobium sp.]
MSPSPITVIGAAVALGLAGGSLWSTIERRSASAQPAPATAPLVRFSVCHTGGGTNCVVDGDTIWMEGEKIRIADIDAPETHPPRCSREAELGERATRRLHELVNAGPFEARIVGNRDTDRYGRKLRVLVRDGRSLGDVLVSEGLARSWSGRREPWC